MANRVKNDGHVTDGPKQSAKDRNAHCSGGREKAQVNIDFYIGYEYILCSNF